MRLRARIWIIGLLAMTAISACTTTVQIQDGAWTAHCDFFGAADCEGIARLFAGNLARSGEGVRQDSGGQIFIERAACTLVEDAEAVPWADLSTCWRAWAPTHEQRACMLIARQKDPAHALGPFGQVGGDNYTGHVGAPDPGTTPC